MDLRVLGRMEALESGKSLQLGPPKQRLVLAFLLLHEGQPVSTDRIVDKLWGARPPASARENVHLHIHRIRRALGPNRLVRSGPLGYTLRLERSELDTHRFTDLVEETDRVLRRGNHARAAALAREALAEWRGEAFAEFDDAPALQHEAARLAELRLQAVEHQVDADLRLGEHHRLIGPLRLLTAEQPYRERFHEQLMLALHRCGRAAEALAAFQQLRRTLADDLGLEPGARLVALQRAVLNGDPHL